MFRKRVDRIRGVAGSLDDHIVLVVGAIDGAGPGIVRVIAEAGAAVHAAATDSAMLDVHLSRVDNTPIPVVPIVADVATPDGRQRLLESVPDPVDAVVINPPLGAEASTLEPTTALMADVATRMQNRGQTGSIVVVNGLSGHGPSPSGAAFLQSEVESLASRVATNGIRVNSVGVGPVGANRRGNPTPSRVSPLGHVSVHPVEVGKAVWFLVNDSLSSGITGTTLKIDRGASLLRSEW